MTSCSGRDRNCPEGGAPVDPVLQNLTTSLTRLELEIAELRADLARKEAAADYMRSAVKSLSASMPAVAPNVENANAPRAVGAPSNTDRVAGPAADVSKQPTPETYLGVPVEKLRNAFRGKGIPAGAMAMLDMFDRPMSEDELVGGLRAGGVVFVSERPVNGFRFALLKKKKETGAVVDLSGKRWALRHWSDNPPPRDPAGLVPTRDPVDHVAKSREGLLAAKERGVRLGSPPKVTAEDFQRMTEMLVEGDTGQANRHQTGG